jgi:hypothetical protein
VHRYWVTFAASPRSLPHGAGLGVGVTADDIDDALKLIQRELFDDDALPSVESVVTDIDVSTLDPGHVLPNMQNPLRRGVWFPMTRTDWVTPDR